MGIKQDYLPSLVISLLSPLFSSYYPDAQATWWSVHQFAWSLSVSTLSTQIPKFVAEQKNNPSMFGLSFLHLYTWSKELEHNQPSVYLKWLSANGSRRMFRAR